MKDKTGALMEFHKTEKRFAVKLPFPVINRSHTAALCSVRSVREQQKSQIFFRDRTVCQPFPVSEKWGLKSKILQNEFWSTDAGCMALLLRRNPGCWKQRYHNKADLRYSRRTGFHIRTDRRCIDPETSDGTHHQTVIHDGCHD